MTSEKWKYEVTIDEPLIYLSDCNRKENQFTLLIFKRKDLNCWLRKIKESFAKDFMVIAGFSYIEKFNIIRVEKNPKLIQITVRKMV